MTKQIERTTLLRSLIAGCVMLGTAAGASAQWARVLTTSPDRTWSLTPSIVQASGTSTTADAIVLKPDNKNQTIDGFGYAMTYSACYNLMKMPKALREILLRQTFSPSEGYGASYVRVSIGCSDFSSTEYTLCDEKGPDDDLLRNFKFHSDETNYVIPILKQIKELNPNVKIMAAPWTAPRWMKKNDDGSDTDSWTGKRLRSEYYPTYGEYFVKFVQGMKDNGLDVYAVSPQNEPLNGGNSASTYMSWDEMADFVKGGLAPAFHDAGLTTKIYLFDHNFNYDNNQNEKDYPFKAYDRMGTDFDGADLVVGSCWHAYGGSVYDIEENINKYSSKEVLFTEHSIGTWNDGRNLYTRLAADMEELIIRNVNRRFVGSIAWNFMLDMNRAPNRPGGCQTCYGAVDVDQNGYRNYTMNSHYYIMAHASDAVKPGAVRVDTEGWWTTGLDYSAFLNPDGSTSILFSNKSDNDITAKVQSEGHTYSFRIPALGVLSAVMNYKDEPELSSKPAEVWLKGSAAENGESVRMNMIAPNGMNKGKFECYTRLNSGSFTFDVTTESQKKVNYGVTDGKVVLGGGSYNVEGQLARVVVDFENQTLSITEINNMKVIGSITSPAWDIESAPEISYVGNGVWNGNVDMSNVPESTNPERFKFLVNKNWEQAISRVKGSEATVSNDKNGYEMEDIPQQHGFWNVTLDMANCTYAVKAPVFKSVTIGGSALQNESLTLNEIGGREYMRRYTN